MELETEIPLENMEEETIPRVDREKSACHVYKKR